jgi:hypothetical protein
MVSTTEPYGRILGFLDRMMHSITEKNSNIYTDLSEYPILFCDIKDKDRFSDLVVIVPGYRSRGPGFDYRHYQIF